MPYFLKFQNKKEQCYLDVFSIYRLLTGGV